jgi:hypothetical protein
MRSVRTTLVTIILKSSRWSRKGFSSSGLALSRSLKILLRKNMRRGVAYAGFSQGQWKIYPEMNYDKKRMNFQGVALLL